MILHDTFTLDRTYPAAAAEVWRCWTDPELRHRWFRGPDGYELAERTLDFRVGGGEVLRGRLPSGTRTSFRATFHVIAEPRHIVSAYIMHLDDVLLSMTLATLELTADGPQTRLRYTEQSAYFDDDPKSPGRRKGGTSWHLDNLGALLADRAR